jgi:hypothetical protein
MKGVKTLFSLHALSEDKLGPTASCHPARPIADKLATCPTTSTVLSRNLLRFPAVGGVNGFPGLELGVQFGQGGAEGAVL